MRRPAESAGAGATIAALIAYVAGVRQPQTYAFIASGVGLVPSVVTLLVANGGVRGVLRLLWRGRRKGWADQ